MNKQRLTVHNPALPVSLLLRAFQEKPSSLGHVYGGKKGDIKRLWCEKVRSVFRCHCHTHTSVGGSNWSERRSGKLCVLAHSEVNSAAVSHFGSKNKNHVHPETQLPDLWKMCFLFFQEASLHPWDFRAFRRWKLGFIRRMWSLLPRKASECRLLHGLEDTPRKPDFVP